MVYQLTVFGFFAFGVVCLSGCQISSSNDDLEKEIVVCENAVTDQWTYLGLEGESVNDIAIHPGNPSVIYAVTRSNFSTGHLGSMFKSEDCGVNWEIVLDNGPGQVHIDPNDPKIIYSSPVRSLDGGDSWSQIEALRPVGGGRAGPLMVNPANSQHLIVGKGSSILSGTVIESRDFGATWQGITAARTDTVLRMPYRIFIHPADPGIFLIGSSEAGLLHRSMDGGETWQVALENVFPADTANPVIRYWSMDAWPGLPDVIYMVSGSRRVVKEAGVYADQYTYRSEDRGATWSLYPLIFDRYSDLEVRINELAAVAMNELYVATYEGMYHRYGAETRSINEGFEDHGSSDPVVLTLEREAGSNLVYAGTQFNGQGFKGGIYVRKAE